MSTDDDRFQTYVDALRSRVNERCLLPESGDDGVATAEFRETAFTEIALEILGGFGAAGDHEMCYFNRRVGRHACKVNGYLVDDDDGRVELDTTILGDQTTVASVPGSEIVQAASRAARVLIEARRGLHEQTEPASPEHDMFRRLAGATDVSQVRVVVLVDGVVSSPPGRITTVEDLGVEAEIDVWDLRRLFRVESSGIQYESIEIDFTSLLGGPLPCVAMPGVSADYDSYVTVIPGAVLHGLYHEHGARLLELNVRSFLQARGKVNQGIRDTLLNEPSRFFAYNNGIAATAERIERARDGAAAGGITKLIGLQIVNGGQTVASIHRAKQRDRASLDAVFVQAKISVVRQTEQLEVLVPLISKFANSQNRVNEADFSANHPFHVKLQQLSQTVWAPGQQSRWFFERARGQFEVARVRDGITSAKLRRFDSITPRAQRFDKVDLGKYLTAWDQLPHVVSLGGQKCFVAFMGRLKRDSSATWEPDVTFFKDLIAKTIIYRRADSIARMHGFPAYRANAIAYTVALLSYRTAGRTHLAQIWDLQAVSDALSTTMASWMPRIHSEIVDSAAGKNVTEWCKREECWRHIQTLDLTLGHALEAELSAGQPLPSVGDPSDRTVTRLSSEDRENIARTMQITAQEWIHICGWGARTGLLQDWQKGIANTLAGYAAGGWTKVPSRKQAAHGVAMLKVADKSGGRLNLEEQP